MSNLALRPIHYACVSGGKDSLFMLNLILNNPDKYPLDMVVHYELEIDYPWVKRVIDEMERRCKNAGIMFWRIKPSKTWDELYQKYGFPTQIVRWCNNLYKSDAEKQLKAWIKAQNCRPLAYFGFCADEVKRFKYDVGNTNWEEQDVCYPLAEEGIPEYEIWKWARDVPLFEGWYRYFKRQGCALCPMASMKELAYLHKYYPELYAKYDRGCREYEANYHKPWKGLGGGWAKLDASIRGKWTAILEDEENQTTLY